MNVPDSLRSRNLSVACVLCFSFALFLASQPLAAAEVTSLHMESDPGEFIGAGLNHDYTPNLGVFRGFKGVDSGVQLQFISFDNAHFWFLGFSAPYAQPLTVGRYDNAKDDVGKVDPAAPGMSIHGDGRACDPNGRFEVLEIVYAPSGEPLSFRAKFEQRCGNALIALRGEIRYHANVYVELSAPDYLPVLADEPLNFNVTATSLEGTGVALTVADLPEGATFTDDGNGHGRFVWTPTVMQTGLHSMTFAAHDFLGQGESVSTQISVGRIVRVPDEFQTIQEAIDTAIPGSRVIVAPGTYDENLHFPGKAIEVRSEAGPVPTIIDGGARGPVVVFDKAERRHTVLSGFTLRNGQEPYLPSYEGGGVSISASSPTIRDNIITSNVGCYGGGIHVDFASPLIIDNDIRGNRSACGSGGGGIYIGGAASTEVIHNTIENNSAVDYGGGIQLWAAGTPRISGNIIRGNVAQEGGGIWIVNGSDVDMIGNLIYGNKAGTGGGVHWFGRNGFRGPRLINNTIAENDAPEGSAITADAFDSTAELINNVLIAKQGQNALWCGTLWDPGPPVLWHNNVYSQGGSAYGGSCVDMTGIDGNVSVEPSFACPETADFRLVDGSHIIDAGDNAIPGLPTLDFEDFARILDGDHDGTATVDMGAYEFDPAGPAYEPCIYAVCPADIEVDARRGETQAAISYLPPSAPARATVECSLPSGSLFPEGTTTVRCSASLTSGHSAACEFKVTVFVRPLNDLVENATVITSLPFTDQVDTRDATADLGEPYCSSQAPAVWYQYTPTEDMTITMDAAGSSYDVQLSAYTRPDDIFYGGNICGPGPFTYFLGGGTTYYFGARPTGEAGHLVFNLTGHVPLRLAVGISQDSTVDRKTGEVRIAGTATCSLASVVVLSGQLVIPRTGAPLVRPFNATFPCLGPTAWEVTLPPTDTRLGSRGVTLSVSGHAEDPVWGETAEASAMWTMRPGANKRSGTRDSKQ
jgi:parallel beta-helix repeat protein